MYFWYVAFSYIISLSLIFILLLVSYIQYKKNIIPAPQPYYLLEKYCGNLSIDEYRKLIGQDKLILLINKKLESIKKS